MRPSSTALSLITLQMLNTGQLTAERMLAVLLGANVGITVTVQLLALHIQDFAGLFILLGVIGFQFFNREEPFAGGGRSACFPPGLHFSGHETDRRRCRGE